MSSQLQDYFEEAVETVARLLYARTRTPREPGWMDLEPRMREGAIRDARVVIDLWITVSSPCLWCHGTGRPPGATPEDERARIGAEERKRITDLLRDGAARRELRANRPGNAAVTTLMASWEALRLAADLIERAEPVTDSRGGDDAPSVADQSPAATPDPRNGCRAPHCFSEYGTPCGNCPVAEKPETDT